MHDNRQYITSHSPTPEQVQNPIPNQIRALKKALRKSLGKKVGSNGPGYEIPLRICKG